MNDRHLLPRGTSALWHPCTQMKDHEDFPPIAIDRGEGVWLYGVDGKRYLDAIGSWWVNLFGHANPRINAAIADQLNKLEHVLLAGFTHEPVLELSERLVQLAPAGLTRCYYASDGSSTVEAALKMSFHYWQNKGEKKRRRYLCLANGYHGETLGALSVGDVALYKETYEPLLLNPITVPSPDCFYREPGESCEAYSRRAFVHVEAALSKHAHETCAVIMEPLVQCAGSMRMHDPIYLKLLRDACTRHDVHLIADEIAVGFGRTGTMFACEQAAVTPDFLLLGKGLTGGYLPLSVCLTREEIYHAFYDEGDKPGAVRKAFLHSHSYAGNPLACRAALETLNIFRDDNVIEKNKVLATHLAKVCNGMGEHPHVAEVRQRGMILAIEMVKNKDTREPYPWQERRGLKAYVQGLTRGAILRPLGNVLYVMPPYVIREDEIAWLARVVSECIRVATKD